jgi:hypothetical protein
MSFNNSSIDLSNNDFEHIKDNCLTNLKILSKIQQGDKLYFSNNVFSIDSPHYTQGVMRWYYAESRNNTLKNLDDLLSNLFITIDTIYKREMNTDQSIENNYYSRMNTTNSVFKEEGSSLMLTFINEIKNCIEGLNNLKITYKNDVSTISAIDVIIEKLNVRVKKMSSILSIDKN